MVGPRILGPAGPRAGLRDERDVRRLVDRRVLGAVDETRQVTAVSVYPSGLLGREFRDVSDDCRDRPRRIKREVGSRAVHPDPQIMLRRRLGFAIKPFDCSERMEPDGCGAGRKPFPQRRAEADNKVESTDRHDGLTQSSDGCSHVLVGCAIATVELEVVVGAGAPAQRSLAALGPSQSSCQRSAHDPSPTHEAIHSTRFRRNGACCCSRAKDGNSDVLERARCPLSVADFGAGVVPTH